MKKYLVIETGRLCNYKDLNEICNSATFYTWCKILEDAKKAYFNEQNRVYKIFSIGNPGLKILEIEDNIVINSISPDFKNIKDNTIIL